jgi:hypothetical protein
MIGCWPKAPTTLLCARSGPHDRDAWRTEVGSCPTSSLRSGELAFAAILVRWFRN